MEDAIERSDKNFIQSLELLCPEVLGRIESAMA
jgi:hypothetical protein